MMGSEHNRMRRKWQDYGGNNAAVAENAFFECFTKVFQGTDYSIMAKPKDFQNIYVNVKLSDVEISEIFSPDVRRCLIRSATPPESGGKSLVWGFVAEALSRSSIDLCGDAVKI
ncbi:MAG: MunI family type II restriction endonuclease [Holosporales bacterium]